MWFSHPVPAKGPLDTATVLRLFFQIQKQKNALEFLLYQPFQYTVF